MTDPIISVSLEDLDRCRWVAVERYLVARERGHVDRNHSGQPMRDEADGALGELALCRFLDVTWSEGVDSYKGPDVGRAIQVRATRWQSGGLIVRPKDKTDHVYVLAVILSDDPDECRVRLAGWIFGAAAKGEIFFSEGLSQRSGAPRWYVTQEALCRPLLRADLKPWI